MTDGTDSKWGQLCELASLETDPVKRLQRIATARHAILDCIEDGFSGKTKTGQTALRDALEDLSRLQTFAESKIQKINAKVPSDKLQRRHFLR
jgi:hypothetical protein